ncbi:MAG: hypothetical protein AVDCRST_MAG04-2193, partial [uncultured Acetobacteraceae bacterium]
EDQRRDRLLAGGAAPKLRPAGPAADAGRGAQGDAATDDRLRRPHLTGGAHAELDAAVPAIAGADAAGHDRVLPRPHAGPFPARIPARRPKEGL